MENHPIPQNVTGFQFKLIGDMTLKQFVYLAAGIVGGWFFFSLPISPFIKFPISILFILAGISFAFLPLAGRPVDVMVANFIKSLFSPTQYIYRKTEAPSTIHAINPNLKILPKTEPKKQAIISIREESIDAVEKQKEKEDETLQEKEDTLEKELKDAKAKEASLDKKSPTPPELHQKVISLEEQLQEILIQKEQLAQQIIDLQKKLSLQKKTVFTPTTLEPKAIAQNVKMVPKNMAKNLGIPLTSDVPNIITGIVKDPRENPLSNILVEIKDKEGNPARAFKTNLLGQFASATPLSNGVYTIEFEDPKAQNKFDAIELSLTGKIIMPIEVKSIDTREELRKSLFGQQTS